MRKIKTHNHEKDIFNRGSAMFHLQLQSGDP